MTQSSTGHHEHTPDDYQPQKSTIVPDEIARAPITNTLFVSDKPDHNKEASASACVSEAEDDSHSHQDTITSTGTTISTSCCCDTTTSTSTTTEEFTKQPTKCTFTQIFAALSVSLADLLIGMSASYSAPAIASMSEENSTLRIPEHGEEASWIGSLMPLSALFGGILAGTLIELLGRKRTILSTALPLILAWLLIALANHIWMLYVARVIAGLCVGIISLSLPVYIAETVQEDVRGRLGLLPTSFGNIGIVICYTAGTFLDWRNLAFLGASLSVPFVICMLFVPDTPRWYISKGKDTKSEKSLQWFRGKKTDIRYEMHQIKSNYNKSTKDAASLKDLFRKMYVKPILVSLGLMFLQQFSGISAVIFYSNTIFKLTGSSIENHTASIIVASVNFGATFILIQLIDRYGRKTLLLVSNTVMIFSLGILGGFFYMLTHHPASVVNYGWVALACLMTFVVFFSLGFGPIPWLILGEIFPLRIRGPAAATATAFNWGCTFFVTKTFPTVVYHFGPHTAFIGFAMICLVGTPFIVCYVPETRGKSLEDIEKKITRRISVISNSAILRASAAGATIVENSYSVKV